MSTKATKTIKDVEIYNGFEINFNQEFINLMDMFRAAGVAHTRKPKFWLQLPNTKEFIETVKKNFKGKIILPLKIVRGRYGGTFAHYQIALAYAKYLSPEFHIWANEVVKERFEEMADPELGIQRARERAILSYVRQGKSLAWIGVRLDGIESRHTFTDTIHKIGGFGKLQYAQLTNTVYQKLFDGKASELKAERRIPQKKNLRDSMSMLELRAIDMSELSSAEKMKRVKGTDKKQAKKKVKEAVDRMSGHVRNVLDAIDED